MQSPKSFLFFVLSIFAAGCASVNAPKNFLPEAERLAEDKFGSWIEISLQQAGKTIKTGGELIAVEGDTLFILCDSIETVYLPEVVSARLVKYNSHAGGALFMSCLGGLSTISHGWFLVFTFPAWMLAGNISTAVRSFEPVIDYPKDGISELIEFARFPQGLPPHFDRKNIQSKNRELKMIAEKRIKKR